MTSEQKRFMDVSALYLSSTAPDVASTTSENRSRRLADYLNSLLEHDVEPGIVAVLAWKRDMADRGMKPSSIQQYLRGPSTMIIMRRTLSKSPICPA